MQGQATQIDAGATREAPQQPVRVRKQPAAAAPASDAPAKAPQRTPAKPAGEPVKAISLQPQSMDDSGIYRAMAGETRIVGRMVPGRQLHIELSEELRSPELPPYRLCVSVEKSAMTGPADPRTLMINLVEAVAEDLRSSYNVEIKPWTEGCRDALVIRLMRQVEDIERNRLFRLSSADAGFLEISGEVLCSHQSTRSFHLTRRSFMTLFASNAQRTQAQLLTFARQLGKQAAENTPRLAPPKESAEE